MNRLPRTLLVVSVTCAVSLSAVESQEPELPEASRGDYSATIKVLKRDGTLAAGEKFRLQLDVSGPDPDVVTGTIPADGLVQLEGLAGGEAGPGYLFLVGNRNLEAERFRLDGAQRHRVLEFTMAPTAGDPAPDIVFQELFADEKHSLWEFRGKYVLLDFWASWCGPCHQPLSELESALRTHKEDWGEKLMVIALSIDDTRDPARAFVRDRDLGSMVHMWSSEGEPGFFSTAQREYRIDSIPTSFLIDPEGTIVWRGTPSIADVPKTLERHLTSPQTD